MAGQDDIVADLSAIKTLQQTLVGIQKELVDGSVKNYMGLLAGQAVDFGGMEEAHGFLSAYKGACAELEQNRQTLSMLLTDLAKAAQTIEDNYRNAAKNDMISAKSVQSALSGVDSDFKR